MRFQYIEYLLLLLLIPVMILMFYLYRRWKQKTAKKIGDLKLVNALITGSGGFNTARFILIIVAFALGVFAIANLRELDGSRKVNRKGIDVMIALDVSKSMLAEDITPNRLERAKQVVAKLIDKLADDRIGLVIFAGKAYLQMPITTDHSAAKLYLSGISPDDIPTQGTVISQALRMSYSAFNTKEKKYRAVLLISDGEDHDEEALEVAKKMADEGIMINTVGIGSPEGATLPDIENGGQKRDEAGNVVISRLNETELINIAKEGKGIYQQFTSTEEVASNIKAKLATLGTTNIVDSSTADYHYYFMYFLMAALILLLFETVYTGKPYTKMKKSNPVLSKTVATATMLLFYFGLSAQPANKEIIKGNDQYNKKAYQEAVSAYQRALGKAPANEVATYNMGNALYKTEQADKAITYYEKVIKGTSNNATKAKAYYNKGVSHQSMKQVPQAIEAYKNALKIDPTDEQARQNLQRLLIQMKQQDKKNNNDKKKDQKQDQDKKDKKEDEQKQPKPQPSKMSKQDAEEKLKALQQHEKDLQDKLRKVKGSGPDKPKKDW